MELFITFSDGTIFSVLASVVAVDMAKYYQENYQDDFRETYESVINDVPELLDWMQNNMDWSEDVQPHARFVGRVECDYDKEFCDAVITTEKP